MDNLVFEESISSEISQSEFISKKWLYVNDINNGSYSSQIIIDSTPLANSGGYVNWSEGYISMPLVVSMEALTGGATIGANANSVASHAWAFKSGFWHMINSMSVEFNNQNIVQQTPFLNVFRSFKAMTSFSLDDVLTEGPTIGFSPDTAGSWAYTTTIGNDGLGLSNNRTTPAMTVTSGVVQSAFDGDPNPSYNNEFGSQYSHNVGFARRNEWYGYTPSATLSKGQYAIMGDDSCASVFRARRLPVATTGLSATKAGWAVMAKLRLKDLADYFEKCPLLKGATMRFLINTNQSTVDFAGTLTAGPPSSFAFTGTPTVNSNGLTCPLMLASGEVGQGCCGLTTGTYRLKVSIYKEDTISPFSVPVRLYAPVYKMNPIAEQRYLSLAPTKRVEYCDIFQYQFNDIGAGQPFNFLVSNGIPNIKSVLVVPFLTPTGNSSTFNTPLSPFSTSGATPDPIPLTQFNILISGVNLFLNNQLYDFEQFNHELKSSNQLNGSLTTGLASGLISEDDFSRGMRYYYGNASRILPSEEGVSRSVQILGTNSSLKAISLMVFVEFKKSMTIDISTGARID
jgi:hypothetical protein